MTSAKEIKSRKFILDHFEIQDGKSGEEEQELIILNKRFCPLFFGTSKIRFGRE